MKLSDLENYVAGLRHIARENGVEDPRVIFNVGTRTWDIDAHVPACRVMAGEDHPLLNHGEFEVPMKRFWIQPNADT